MLEEGRRFSPSQWLTRGGVEVHHDDVMRLTDTLEARGCRGGGSRFGRERREVKDDRFFSGLRVLTPAGHRELHRQEDGAEEGAPAPEPAARPGTETRDRDAALLGPEDFSDLPPLSERKEKRKKYGMEVR